MSGLFCSLLYIPQKKDLFHIIQRQMGVFFSVGVYSRSRIALFWICAQRSLKFTLGQLVGKWASALDLVS